MNSELVKWLIHQPALFIGGFIFGVYAALKFPGMTTPENLQVLSGLALSALGFKMSYDQAGPRQTWIEAPQQTKPESEKS